MNFGGMIAKVCDAPRVPTASALQARHAPRAATPLGLATCRAVGLAKAQARQRSRDTPSGL